MKKQVSLADAAAHNNLDSITSAGIIFRDTDDIFIMGKAARMVTFVQFQIQKLDRQKRYFVADGKTATDMAVESYTAIP